MVVDCEEDRRKSLQGPVNEDEVTALEVLITLSGWPSRAKQTGPSASDAGTPSPRKQPKKTEQLTPLFPGVQIPKRKASPP